MGAWQASSARLRFSEIVDEAVAGRPQFIQRRDGKEVVVVSRDYYEKTKANLKSFLLNAGYSGPGEDAFNSAMRDVRASTANMFALRRSDPEGRSDPKD